MAVQVYETFESGNGTIGGANPSRELRFTATGSELTLEVQQAVEAALPAYLAGLFFDSYDLSHLGAGVWSAVAKYGPRARPDPGQSPGGSGGSAPPNTSPRLSPAEREPALNAYTESFETTGGTSKKMQSYKTTRYAKDGYIAPDFHGAIQVNGDNVDGCEVTTPQFGWTEVWHLPVLAVTGPYKQTLYQLTGTINDIPFRGFAAGEVLFLGASGSVKWDDGWEVTYRFSAQPNATGLTVGDITGIDKRGWDYLWARYESKLDENSPELVVRAKHVYVEEVYVTGDFTALGIGS